MQEAQNQWETYQENNEIEQIWYSSRRISDKMQVRDKQASWIYIEWNKGSRYWKNDDPHSVNVQMNTLTITQYWQTDYKEVNWDIRIPLWWWYLLSWEICWWVSSATMRMQVQVDWKVVYQFDWNTITEKTPVYQVLNLWKYDIMNFWVQTIDYSWSSNWITTTWYIELYLTKL